MPQSVGDFKAKFNAKLCELLDKKGSSSKHLSNEKYKWIVYRLSELSENPTLSKSSQDYRMMNKYDILLVTIDGVTTKKLKEKGSDRIYVDCENIFDAINTEHLSSGHGARDVTHNKVGELYANVTREFVQLYVDHCETCLLKKSKVRKSLVVKPITSNALNSRCQIDLIDMQSQPDGEKKFILDYQDHLTKFVVLRPLVSKRAEEVAYHVLDIFCFLGAPHVLQSDNGREFANRVVKEVIVMWPGCKLVHGKPRHSQSQGSVERANQDVENILACWLRENDTLKWGDGLRFVQWQKNNRHHRGIGRSPYQAMFGDNRYRDYRGAALPNEVWQNIETEEQLAEALNTAPLPEESSNENESENDSSHAEEGAYESDLLKAIVENEDAIEFAIQNDCSVCDQRYEGSSKCSRCFAFCHDTLPCSVSEGQGILCQLCCREDAIENQRSAAHTQQAKQADVIFYS